MKLYKLESKYVKENYPIFYKVFSDGKGYRHFKQVGMKLKLKAIDNQVSKYKTYPQIRA